MVLPNCEKWFKNMKNCLSKENVHLKEIAMDFGITVDLLIEKLRHNFD